MASAPQNEFLVISRGQWDPALEREQIQAAIDRFYVWIEEMCAAGKMKRGQRLGDRGRTVTRSAVTDGPFGESKEVIGGYWFIVAADLDEAARLAVGNPCLECGLFYEIRPVDPQRASAFNIQAESPSEHRRS
jgi:hypothetical protein